MILTWIAYKHFSYENYAFNMNLEGGLSVVFQ